MNIENDSPRKIDGEMTPPPFQAGDDFDGEIVQTAVCLSDGVWFFSLEDQGYVWMAPEVVTKIPEPLRSACPLVESWRQEPIGWLSWDLPKPRRRRKAVA